MHNHQQDENTPLPDQEKRHHDYQQLTQVLLLLLAISLASLGSAFLATRIP